MTKYTVKKFSDESSMEDCMNDMAVDGFNVVAVILKPTGEYVVTFKR